MLLHKQIVVSNEPPLSGSAIVLVESRPRHAAMLTERFLSADPRLGENLAPLGLGESIVNSGGDVTYTNWGKPVQRLPSVVLMQHVLR